MFTYSRPPRVAAIHDLSGIGKCSLTVALPILSACGIETACMPTAILSTHTGGFTDYTFRDLTNDMEPFWKHWKRLNLSFQAIYTGYLGNADQASIVSDIFDAFKTDDSIILVDPAMADNGRLYRLFDQNMVRGQAALCARADVIAPNMTEAAFLLGEEWQEGPYEDYYLRDVCRKLCAMGAKRVVLTGVYYGSESLGACCYDRSTGSYSVYLSPRVPGSYHGTGDIYSSVLLAGLLNRLSLHDSMALAVDFTYECLIRSFEQKTDPRFGVDFEHGLAKLSARFSLTRGE